MGALPRKGPAVNGSPHPDSRRSRRARYFRPWGTETHSPHSAPPGERLHYVQSRTAAADIATKIPRHSFRATSTATYL
jgi:hypothetical protein